MTYQIPVVDLEAALSDSPPPALIDTVRAAVEQFGVVQVVHHGVDPGLIDEFSRHAGDLLARPRAEKATLASPTGHPYRGWRQWPDDFGRLELERFNVAQFDNAEDARAAGVPEEYLGLYAHVNVWPPDDPAMREVTFRYIEASWRLAERMLMLYTRAVGAPGWVDAPGHVEHQVERVQRREPGLKHAAGRAGNGASDERRPREPGERGRRPGNAP